MLLAGTDQTDEVSHQILGLLTPTAPDGSANPYYDRVAGTGPRDHRLAQREAYLRGAYASADARLGLVRSLLHDPDVLASQRPRLRPAVVRGRRAAACSSSSGCRTSSRPATAGPAAASAPGGTIAKACWAGGTAQIYLNLKGRNPDGVLDPAAVPGHGRRDRRGLPGPEGPGHRQAGRREGPDQGAARPTSTAVTR